MVTERDVVMGHQLLDLPGSLDTQLAVSEAQNQKLNFKVLMANKMVNRLAQPKVEAATFPMLMAACTSPKGNENYQIKQM